MCNTQRPFLPQETMRRTYFPCKPLRRSNNRNISEIPHPFVIESMKRFATLSMSAKRKIYFIHFNHTNPLLTENNEIAKKVMAAGFNIARLGDIFTL